MSELFSLLANGPYVFYKSLQNSSLLKPVYPLANARIQGLTAMLNGTEDSTFDSIQYSQFQQFIKTYIAKMKSIAQTLRNNEIIYINTLISKGRGNGLLSSENINKLQSLNSKTGLKESDYKELINALNIVQYDGNINKLKQNIAEQEYNINALQTNLEELKKHDINAYNNLKDQYINNYKQYIKNYSTTIKNTLKDNYAKKRRTKIQSMASTINRVLQNLSTETEIQPIIAQLWEEHPLETSITINSKDSPAFDGIIEIVVNKVLNAKEATAQTITNSIIDDINSRKIVLPQLSNIQAPKVMTKFDNSATIEEALKQSNMAVIELLRISKNAKELLESFFPDNPKKVKTILSNLQLLEKALNNVPKEDIKKTITYFKLHSSDKQTFSSALANDLKNTTHYKNIVQALKSKSMKQLKADQNYNIIVADRLYEDLRANFSVKIDKSGLAELVAEKLPEIAEITFSTIPGNSVNLKDDVWCAFRINSLDLDQVISHDDELTSLLNDIDSIIEEHFSTFITDYSKDTSNGKKRGETKVESANTIYIEKMQKVIDKYKQIQKDQPELFNKLQEYAKESTSFLESISVKEYDLYDNDIGFHAGTLGPTPQHILNNIQKMYEKGGITPIQTELLQLALLNCSDAAVGGSPLRKSLEMYLLGGAALIVFDEGMGNAQQYLTKMEPEIQKILPKNLNLYFLNSTYIPASYIIESIAQNLEAFYEHELNENIEALSNRNRVIISNVPEMYVYSSNNIITDFELTSQAVLNATNIQFVFMSGMLSIFQNLATAFKT